MVAHWSLDELRCPSLYEWRRVWYRRERGEFYSPRMACSGRLSYSRCDMSDMVGGMFCASKEIGVSLYFVHSTLWCSGGGSCCDSICKYNSDLEGFLQPARIDVGCRVCFSHRKGQELGYPTILSAVKNSPSSSAAATLVVWRVTFLLWQFMKEIEVIFCKSQDNIGNCGRPLLFLFFIFLRISMAKQREQGENRNDFPSFVLFYHMLHSVYITSGKQPID